RRGDLFRRPAVASVGRGRDDERLGQRVSLFLAAERGQTHVNMAEERTTGSVVGPDLILVAEGRRRLLRHDDRVLPGARVAGGRLDIVGARDGNRLEALEGRLPREGGGQVAVVQARAVPPGKLPVRVRLWAKRQRRIAVGDKAALEVVRQRPDRAELRFAPR